MAFYNTQDDQDEELLQEGQVPVSGQQSSTIGTSGPSASQDQQSATPSSAGSPSTFAGIQDYVNANKGQTTKLANDVGGLVTNYGNQARDSITQGVDKFNQAVDQNTIKGNEQVYNQISNDPTQLASDDAKRDEVIRMRDAQYGGPTSLDTTDFYQPIYQAFNKAKEASDSTQSDSGQRTLLSQLQNSQRGKVNQGSLQLNSALLQGDTNARSILDQAKSSNSDLESLFNSAKENSISTANAGKATTDQTRQTTNNTLSNSWQALKDLVNSKVTTAQAGYTPASVLSSTGTPITDTQLNDLGLTRAQYNAISGDSLINSNLAQYVQGSTNNVNPIDINANTVASSEDYAREQALIDLMGSDEDFITTPELAGTGNAQSGKFDIEPLVKKGVDNAQYKLNQANAELAAAKAANDAIWKPVGWTAQPKTPKYEAEQRLIRAQQAQAAQQAQTNADIARYNALRNLK